MDYIDTMKLCLLSFFIRSLVHRSKNTGEADWKTGVKLFGRCKNNGIKNRPFLSINPLFQGGNEIMDAEKLVERIFL